MKQYYTPLAIVIAGGLIAFSVFTRTSMTTPVFATERDGGYVYGNRDAEIKIVEFSDFECPFCARVHPTLKRIVDESGGSIAWQYRHLPLPNHENAEMAAYAAECTGTLAGNEAFWAFTEKIFSTDEKLSASLYENIATEHGIDVEDFRACLADDEIHTTVIEDRKAAIAHGGQGTPFSVVVFEDGSMRPVSGALPYEQWVQILKKPE